MGGTAQEAAYLFDALRYYTDTGEMHAIRTPGGSSQFPGVSPMISPYADGSDALANTKASVLGFEHVGTNSFIAFKAFITNFAESYNSEWNTEVIFGRHDPVYGYKNTQRTITLGWKLPAATLSEGIENLARTQAFLKMLYPGYDVTYLQGMKPISHLVQAPHIRVQFMNMLARYADGDPGFQINRAVNVARRGPVRKSPAISYGRQTVGRGGHAGGTPSGLLGAITSVTINHNLDGDIGVFHGQGGIIPKLIEIDITFAPVHEIPLGWDEAKISTAGPARMVDQGQGYAFSNGFSCWPYGVNDGAIRGTPDQLGNPHGQGLTQDNIDNAVTALRTFRDNEADVLNAEARYSGLFGRALAKYDANACAGGQCKGHRASAGRGAVEFFNRRGNRETQRRQQYTSPEGLARLGDLGIYDPRNAGFGTNPAADSRTARKIRETRRNKKNNKN